MSCLGKDDLQAQGQGLKRITVHALFCIIAIFLLALTALRLNRPEKARSIALSHAK
jgi:hypothetical protein